MSEFTDLVSKLAISQRMSHEYLIYLESYDHKGRIKQLYNRALSSADMLCRELKKHVTDEVAMQESRQTIFLGQAHDLLLNIAATLDEDMMKRAIEGLIKVGEVKS